MPKPTTAVTLIARWSCASSVTSSRNWAAALLVAGSVVLQSLLDVSLPILISRTLDQFAAGQTNLVLNAALIATISSLAWVFNFVRRSFSSRAVAAVVLKLREDAFDAVLKRDPVLLRSIHLGQDRESRQLRHRPFHKSSH
ncbi:MAG: hypothetical protein U0559_02400 [Anaerolineae bacterium]